ncbi:hypothetical protein GCM10027169_24870 [Gordonia jinhuaensis]|uniref:Uncharacterized protein n=1 Tax=Gordonia jinhuaensis TaxID=1517702 RepID=A0A916TF08_9ACTN|nr:hypothetical protein GCM10011489_29750 [Gordonia jinhuaensis]
MCTANAFGGSGGGTDQILAREHIVADGDRRRLIGCVRGQQGKQHVSHSATALWGRDLMAKIVPVSGAEGNVPSASVTGTIFATGLR